MEKTTVYLTADQKSALAAAAREQGRSEARLIRDGIQEVLAGHVAREAPVSIGDQPLRDVSRGPVLGDRPRWVSREVFVHHVLRVQADPELAAELRDLAPDLTDQLPDR
ncbi:MAG: hypothetical protein HYX57_01850 [Chloroflexi bacterium]|nr:hypothetical protein [Chloroflexota bacterium]